MNCPLCNQTLFISNTIPASEDGKIKVNQTMVCTNPNCNNYSGKDLNNPDKVVKEVKNDW